MSVPPTLISATPGDNSTAVAVGSNIVLTFSENVFFGSGTLLVSDGATQSYYDMNNMRQTRWIGVTDARSVSAGNSQITIAGNTVTINLANDLKAGLNYSVYLPRGFLVDSDNLPFAGLLDSSKLNFTTAGGATAPTALIGPTLSFEDSGISNSDYITNSAAQTVHGTYSGTLGVGESVQVSVDNGLSWQTASASGGNWFCSNFAPLTASSTLVARVVNGQGMSSGSVSHSFVYDATAPTVSSVHLSDTNLTAGETATVTITFSEQVSNFSILNQTVHGATYGAWVSTDNGLSWSATVTPDPMSANPDIDDQLVLGGTDAAGNSISGNPVHVPGHAIDTTFSLNISALSADRGASIHDFVTNTSAQTISGTLVGNLPGTSHVQVSLDDGSTWNNASVNNSNHTWQYSGATLLDGEHTIKARVIDENNLTSNPVSHNYTLDTTVTALSGTTPGQGDTAVDVNTGTIVLTFAENVYMDVTGVFVLSDGNPNHDLQLGVEGGAVSVVGNQITITLPQQLSPGTNYQLNLDGGFIKDLAGNVLKNANNDDLNAGSSSVSVLGFHTFQDVVVTPPSTPSLYINDTGSATDPGSESSDGVTRDTTVHVTNLTGGSVGWEFSLDGGSSWNAGSGDTFTLSEGDYAANQIVVHQIDGALVSGDFAYSSPLHVDLTAPDAGLSPDLTSFGASATAQVITGGYSFTNDSNVIVEVSFDLGGSWTRATVGTPSGLTNTWSVTGAAYQPIIARISDAAGNLAEIDNSGQTEAVIGSSGNDTFAVNNGQLQYGGLGDDNFFINAANITGRIAGGAGTDVLNLGFSNATLNLNNYTSSAISGIDVLNVSGSHVTLSITDATILESWADDSSGAHILHITGDNTTRVNLWGAGFTVTGSGGGYTTLTHSHNGVDDVLLIGAGITYYLTPP